MAEKVDLRIVTLPDELDPCRFLAPRAGPRPFASSLSGAVDALEHNFSDLTRGSARGATMHAANQALEQMLAIAAQGPATARRRAPTTGSAKIKFLQRLARQFRVRGRIAGSG